MILRLTLLNISMKIDFLGGVGGGGIDILSCTDRDLKRLLFCFLVLVWVFFMWGGGLIGRYSFVKLTTVMSS